MNHSHTATPFNLTSADNPVLGARLTASLLMLLVMVFAATGEQAGLILACALLTVAWPLFVFAWFCARTTTSPSVQAAPRRPAAPAQPRRDFFPSTAHYAF